MSRYRVVFLLTVIALIGSLTTGRDLWWSILGAMLAVLVVARLWAWSGIRKIGLRRRALTRVAQAGQTLEEEFTLTNFSRIPKLWIEVRDHSTLPNHFASRVVSAVSPKQWRAWRVKTFCTQRGRYVLGPVTLKSGDPLGVYQREMFVDESSSILVYPAVYDLRDFPLPMGYLPGGEALRRRTHYVTTNAAGVRDYVNGDTLNRIHWPLSVKRQRLTVKEFELDPMAELWLMLDMNAEVQVHNEVAPEVDEYSDALSHLQPKTEFRLPRDTEEYAVSVAASVARFFLNRGRALGFIAYAQHREVQACDLGERQLSKIMEMLSVLRADGSTPFERVLKAEGAQLPRGATVICVSASPDVEWAMAVQQLTRSGLRVVALVVDGQSFGDEISSAPVVSALAEAGAVVRVVKYGEDIAGAIEAMGVRG
ncbi:MAG TPA: DUF58 domain-containing protein [Thermoflexales bacterium]|nr:DUF58 domain-containing protein [Thermoflexales bacterium]HQW34651.1 DUF58 domain-containing protein [Thermoflexales bacterium]HQZ21114.1 DUF58 domain-containing protein [Thermoflexales bacterium]